MQNPKRKQTSPAKSNVEAKEVHNFVKLYLFNPNRTKTACINKTSRCSETIKRRESPYIQWNQCRGDRCSRRCRGQRPRNFPLRCRLRRWRTHRRIPRHLPSPRETTDGRSSSLKELGSCTSLHICVSVSSPSLILRSCVMTDDVDSWGRAEMELLVKWFYISAILNNF